MDYLDGGKILTTPAIRRLAMEYKVHLQQVRGTGKNGRILKEDVLNHISSLSASSQSNSEIELKAPKPVDGQAMTIIEKQPISKVSKVVPLTEDRMEPFSNVTKAMFKTMTKSLSIPHFGLSDEIDISKLIALRSELKQIALEKNLRLSLMPFFIKAASLALLQYPILNSTINIAAEKIIYKSSHNIGVAVDTKQGLLVPNIKNVNQLNIIEIVQELNRLQDLAQKGQLGMKDLSDGTFTLSNIGSVCHLPNNQSFFVGFIYIQHFSFFFHTDWRRFWYTSAHAN